MESSDLQKQLENALNEIRPFLQSDGGDIELISFDEDSVKVKLLGACNTCSVSHTTLKSGVETTIKKYLPHIKEVVSV